MTSYIQRILIYRAICFALCFIGFCIYYLWYLGVPQYLSSALVIISDGRPLSELYKLFDVIPAWGGEDALNGTISYMQKLTMQYFFIIYAFEVVKGKELVNILVPKGFENVDDYEFYVLFTRALIIIKFFIGMLLFRYIVIPLPIPLGFITCVVIYTLIVNGIFYAGLKSNEKVLYPD